MLFLFGYWKEIAPLSSPKSTREATVTIKIDYRLLSYSIFWVGSLTIVIMVIYEVNPLPLISILSEVFISKI
jgi:hypothetical protein